MHRMLIGSLMRLAALPTCANAASSPDHNQKAILVTGASTGIGRRITERLAADGYFVYAGARKQADLQALGAIQNVQAVPLDVTKPEDIDASEPLFAPDNRLGLDSLSALELLSAIEFTFDIVFPSDGSAKQHFESIATLAAFIDSARG